MTVILDQSGWGQISLVGADRMRFLQGMCMSDVSNLKEPGDWLKTAMLSHKGRVLSIFDVIHRGDSLLVVCRPELSDKTETLLDKHLIADDVELVREQNSIYRVFRCAAEVWTAPAHFAPLPSPASPESELECLRIEAGLPRYGVDVDEKNFPFETPLSQLIDYEKGCYVGQEPVARVHARGAPSKELRGLSISGEEEISEGAQLLDAEGKEAGSLRSRCRSPRLGWIALAYVKRGHLEGGTALQVEGRPCEIQDLPFPGSAGTR